MPDTNKPVDDGPVHNNNYDMTVLHMNLDDESDDSLIFAAKTSTNQKKAIPQWARSECDMDTIFVIDISFV